MKSDFLSLGSSDLIKGGIVAVLTVVTETAITLLNSGTFFTKGSLIIIGTAALSAFIAYLSKQFLTNSQGQFAVTEARAIPEVVKPIQSLNILKK